MHSALLTSIIVREGLEVISDAALDEAAGNEVFSMLLIAGDANRLAESNDVAVIFPEIAKALDGNVTALVAAFDSEREFQKRFRFNKFPCVVFLRYGEYLGVIQGVRDWSDYMTEISEILLRDPSEPPPFRLPDGCGVPASLQTH